MSASMLDFDLRLERSGFSFAAHASVPLQGVTAVLGPSGSGKTTLLRALAGLERAVQGSIVVSGNTWQESGKKPTPPDRRGVGYVFQEAALFPHLSALGNLEYAWSRVPANRRTGSIEDVTRLLGIEHLLQRHVRALSGGERQRIALARALLSCPRLLLMDEPLASLDDAGKLAVLDGLQKIHDETRVPILYVTHNTMEVARLADRVLLFDAGEIRASGPVQDLLCRVELYGHGGQHVLSVIEAHLDDYDDEHHIATFRFDEGHVLIPTSTHPTEKHQRIVVRASDVSLSLVAPSQSSVLNCVPVVVEDHRIVDGTTVLVRCRAGETPLVAAITTFSFMQLALSVGSRCFAQFKAVPLRPPSTARSLEATVALGTRPTQ